MLIASSERYGLISFVDQCWGGGIWHNLGEGLSVLPLVRSVNIILLESGVEPGAPFIGSQVKPNSSALNLSTTQPTIINIFIF